MNRLPGRGWRWTSFAAPSMPTSTRSRSGLPGHQVRGRLSRDHVTGLIAVMLGIAWAIPYLTIAITTMPWTPNPDPFPLAMTAVLTTWVAPMLLALLWGRVSGAGRRVLAVTAVGLAAVGLGRMVVTLASSALAPYPRMLPYPDEFMTLGTAMVLAGTLLGAVAL